MFFGSKNLIQVEKDRPEHAFFSAFFVSVGENARCEALLLYRFFRSRANCRGKRSLRCYFFEYFSPLSGETLAAMLWNLDIGGGSGALKIASQVPPSTIHRKNLKNCDFKAVLTMLLAGWRNPEIEGGGSGDSPVGHFGGPLWHP